jgi:hypothetical protein
LQGSSTGLVTDTEGQALEECRLYFFLEEGTELEDGLPDARLAELDALGNCGYAEPVCPCTERCPCDFDSAMAVAIGLYCHEKAASWTDGLPDSFDIATDIAEMHDGMGLVEHWRDSSTAASSQG